MDPDKTVTVMNKMHKLVDEGNLVRILPVGDSYLVAVQTPDGQLLVGMGKDIGDALDESQAVAFELAEEGSS